MFASPGYSYWPESDAEWEKDLKYFSEIGRQLADKRNVQVTFREQYQRLDNRGLRIEEMARTLQARRLASCPLRVCRAGGGFRRLQPHVRLQSRAHGDVPRRRDALQLQRPRAQRVAGAGQRQLCLEQPRAGLRSTRSNSPAAPCVKRRRNTRPAHGIPTFFSADSWTRPVRRSTASGRRRRWPPCFGWSAIEGRYCRALPGSITTGKMPLIPGEAQAERNRQAKQLVDRAAAACDTPAKADLLWMGRCLEVSARFCTLCDALHREKLPRAEIDARAARTAGLAGRQFPVPDRRAGRRRSGLLEKSRSRESVARQNDWCENICGAFEARHDCDLL